MGDLPKKLDNSSVGLYVIPQPFALFEQTGDSTTMLTGVTYPVKPTAGTAPLNIWSNIQTQGGISVDSAGNISFTQAGQYIAVFQGSIGGAIEYGRALYRLRRVGALTSDNWIIATVDIGAYSSTRTTHTASYSVNAGDVYQLTVRVEDTWQTGYQVLIKYNRLAIYMAA